MKVIQLLQHFEQLASVCAQAVAAWSLEYGVKAIVGEIMREIVQKSSEELAREGSGVKAFSSFLSELSTLVPRKHDPQHQCSPYTPGGRESESTGGCV